MIPEDGVQILNNRYQYLVDRRTWTLQVCLHEYVTKIRLCIRDLVNRYPTEQFFLYNFVKMAQIA